MSQYPNTPAVAPLPPPPTPPSITPPSPPCTVPPQSRSPFVTEPDEFGLYRIYPNRPSAMPTLDTSLASLCDSPSLARYAKSASTSSAAAAEAPTVVDVEAEKRAAFAPFPNLGTALTTYWQQTGSSTKSNAEMDRLTAFQQHFPATDVKAFRAQHETRRLDKHIEADCSWNTSSVRIRLPPANIPGDCGQESAAPTLTVDKVMHRSIIDIVTDVYSNKEIAPTLHTTPFELRCESVDGSSSERIYGELFTSPALLEEHVAIQQLSGIPDDGFERIVAPILLGSDATHLAQFGDASLWPFYMMIAAQSKYTLARPSAHACHHLAYVPSVCSCYCLLSSFDYANTRLPHSFPTTFKTNTATSLGTKPDPKFSPTAKETCSTKYGTYSLTRSLWTHTKTESWWIVAMADDVVSSPGFSPIQLIIPRSMSCYLFLP